MKSTRDGNTEGKREWQSYPTLLGRLPIFVPTKNREWENIHVKTPWGSVNFQGKRLTTFDEDIFIALLNLGKRKDYTASDGDTFATIVFEGTINAIIRHTQKTVGSDTYDQINNSLEALKSVTIGIEIEYGSHNNIKKFRYSGSLVHNIETVSDSAGHILGIRVVLNARIADVIGACRHIDMCVRSKLSPTGKALHRFLSCHAKEIKLKTETIRQSIAPHMRNDNFNNLLSRAIKQLSDLKFIKEVKRFDSVYMFTMWVIGFCALLSLLNIARPW